MFGFDDAAKMGLGAINTGVQIFGNQAQKRYGKKTLALQNQMKGRSHKFEQTELGYGQQDVNREAAEGKQEIQGDANERGVLNSSIPAASSNKLEAERQRRYNSLQRKMDYNEGQFQDEAKVQQWQKKSQRMANNMALISQALMQGGAGVGQHFGGQG